MFLSNTPVRYCRKYLNTYNIFSGNKVLYALGSILTKNKILKLQPVSDLWALHCMLYCVNAYCLHARNFAFTCTVGLDKLIFRVKYERNTQVLYSKTKNQKFT